MPTARIKARSVSPAAIAFVVTLVALSSMSVVRAKACAPEHNPAVVDALNQL